MFHPTSKYKGLQGVRRLYLHPSGLFSTLIPPCGSTLSRLEISLDPLLVVFLLIKCTSCGGHKAAGYN